MNIISGGAKVMVYRNLTKNCWSIKSKVLNRVIAHADELVLSDCVFKVSEKGRQRVINERKKYVHAGVHGNICTIRPNIDEFISVRYNPYINDSFVTLFDVKVERADIVCFDKEGRVFADGI